MTRSESNEWQTSLLLFHLTGYGLLLFVLFDLIDTVFPPRFMNPVWEFQTIGAVVERVPLPLLGLVLVFYGEANFRAKWEATVLKLLSRASLLVGVLFLLLIPLCVSNALRINGINNNTIATQSTQQMSQIRQLEEQLGKATANDLESLLARINAQGGSPDINNPQELKSRLLTEVNKTEKALNTQAKATRRDKRFGLLKSSLKWNLGALISGVLFIRIWQATHWARESTKRRRGW